MARKITIGYEQRMFRCNNARRLMPTLASNTMKKPMAQRKSDVASKLGYVSDRFQELIDELYKGKSGSHEPAHLVHIASDILATSRECFDYLGKDIVDLHIVPFTQNPKIKHKHASGKLRTYFPFHIEQLIKPKELFHELQQTSPALYSDLISFTESISNKETIPNTLFKYELFLDILNMVNEKKHNKLIAIVSESDQEYLVENKGFKMIIPKKGQSGYTYFTVAPGSRVSCVAEYQFEYNYREVKEFCLFAHKATKLIIQKFYIDHFQ